MSSLNEVDGLLITNPTNIRYLTGFIGASPTEREAYVLLTKDVLYFFTNALYLEQAKKLVISSQFVVRRLEIVEVSREAPLAKQLKKIIRHAELVSASQQPSENKIPKQARGDSFRLGYEDTNLTVSEHVKLQLELKNVEFVSLAGRIEELRKIKKSEEIAHTKKAARITDDCFEFILPKLTPGVTETEIAWEIETFFRKNGADSAFSPIVAFNKHSSQPHYSPGRYTLDTKPSLILLDFGARFDGYCADMTRVVFFGQPSKKQKQAYEVLKNAQEQVLIALQNGVRGGAALDQMCRELIEQSGLPLYPHSLGHAVGLDIHESPRLSFKQDAELKAGMVITIEPGIYLPGDFGLRIEDLVLITDDGFELLSQSPKELCILTP